MYAWFVKGQHPRTTLLRMFRNPRCNLHQFWCGGRNLYFTHVRDAKPLTGGPGTLVTDCPFDSTFLFPNGAPNAGKPQYLWKPFTIAFDGLGKAEGMCWQGVHVTLAAKVANITIPKLTQAQNERARGKIIRPAV